jgi:urea transporter
LSKCNDQMKIYLYYYSFLAISSVLLVVLRGSRLLSPKDRFLGFSQILQLAAAYILLMSGAFSIRTIALAIVMGISLGKLLRKIMKRFRLDPEITLLVFCLVMPMFIHLGMRFVEISWMDPSTLIGLTIFLAITIAKHKEIKRLIPEG